MARRQRKSACAGWCSRAWRRFRERRNSSGSRRTSRYSISSCRKSTCSRFPAWAAPAAGSRISVWRRNGIEALRRPTLCWRPGDIEHRCDAMELRRIIPTDITASAIVHVSLLTLMLLFSEVHPFGAVTAEQIPVEIVTPQELAEKQAPPEEPPADNKPAETKPEPQPDFSLLDKPAAATAPPPAAPPAT